MKVSESQMEVSVSHSEKQAIVYKGGIHVQRGGFVLGYFDRTPRVLAAWTWGS